MIPGSSHISQYRVLVGKHALGVHVPGPRDQILLIYILTCQRKTNQMTAVIEKSPVYMIVLGPVPSGRFHAADISSFLPGQCLCPHKGTRPGTASQLVKRAVNLVAMRLAGPC